jgi:hypothetical protein
MITGLGAFALHYLVIYLRMMQLGADIDPAFLSEVYEKGLNTILDGKEYAIQGQALVSEKMNSINWLLNGSVVGASGALFGLLIGFGLLFPNVKLMLLFPPIPIKARTLALGYGALELYLALQNPGDGVAHFAHLGGMLVGYILLKYWQKRGKAY